MLMIVLLTVLFVFITYVYIRWLQLKQYWGKRGVPHLPRILYVAVSPSWQEKILHHGYDGCTRSTKDTWVCGCSGSQASSSTRQRSLLIKDQANFRNRYANSGTTDPVGSLNLFTLDDPLWSIIRRQISVIFTASKLKGQQNLVMQRSKDLVERIKKEIQKPEPIDLKHVLSDFSTDIIGTSSFGVASNATLTGESIIRTITEEFLKLSIKRGLEMCSVFLVPQLVDIFRFKLFPKKSVHYMRSIIRKVIVEKGGIANKVVEPRDLLDVLIKIKQEDNKELDMTENMMIAQAAVFLQAGFEATSITLCFALNELAFCHEAQDKLYKELLEAKCKHDDELLDASDLSQLTYLNCVIKETLRKYPPLGWFDRMALEDYKVDDRLTIAAGTPVMVNVMGIHYDADFYPDPESFQPERFLHDDEDSTKFVYFPFGDGPRKCIGERFGRTIVRHGLASLVLNYQLLPLANSPKPSEIKLDKKAMFTSPGEKISIQFVPRK